MTTEVLIYPVLLTLVMVVFQFALHAHAQQLVSAAAEDAVDRVRRGGSEEEGREVARWLLDTQAPTLLSNTSVVASTVADRVRVEVRGSVASIVPFVDLDVVAVDEGPIERFVSQPER